MEPNNGIWPTTTFPLDTRSLGRDWSRRWSISRLREKTRWPQLMHHSLHPFLVIADTVLLDDPIHEETTGPRISWCLIWRNSSNSESPFDSDFWWQPEDFRPVNNWIPKTSFGGLEPQFLEVRTPTINTPRKDVKRFGTTTIPKEESRTPISPQNHPIPYLVLSWKYYSSRIIKWKPKIYLSPRQFPSKYEPRRNDIHPPYSEPLFLTTIGGPATPYLHVNCTTSGFQLYLIVRRRTHHRCLSESHSSFFGEIRKSPLEGRESHHSMTEGPRTSACPSTLKRQEAH